MSLPCLSLESSVPFPDLRPHHVRAACSLPRTRLPSGLAAEPGGSVRAGGKRGHEAPGSSQLRASQVHTCPQGDRGDPSEALSMLEAFFGSSSLGDEGHKPPTLLVTFTGVDCTDTGTQGLNHLRPHRVTS